MNKKELIKLQKNIDEYADTQNKVEIENTIKELEDKIEQVNDLYITTNLYYLLGNCYSELNDLKIAENDLTIWEYEQTYLFKSIFYYRKSVIENGFEEHEIQLKVGILTNLANSFNQYGRPIEALNYYNQALFELKKEQVFKGDNFNYPNNIMLLVNKGYCLQNYSIFLYDHTHSHLFHKEAYKYYSDGIQKLDSFIKEAEYNINYDYYKDLRNNVNERHTNLEGHFGLDFLKEVVDYNEYKLSENVDETKYKQWCLDNKLFLNPMNDLGNYNIASQDILGLPNLITPIEKGFPIFITYFNQIKQEFIFNRSLLYEGLNNITKKFYDNDKNIIDDFDYNIYNMDIEKIKISFRGFYGLFDKISYLLNEYFELGFNDRNIDFNKIWKNKNNPTKLNPKLLQLNNHAIKGLYLLNRDINFNKDEENEFNMSLEPHSKSVAKIRNHLEHKFLMVKEINLIEENDRERKYYQITTNDLIKETIRLSQLTRETIIYTSLSIYIEEENKKQNNKKLAVEQQLNVYDK